MNFRIWRRLGRHPWDLIGSGEIFFFVLGVVEREGVCVCVRSFVLPVPGPLAWISRWVCSVPSQFMQQSSPLVTHLCADRPQDNAERPVQGLRCRSPGPGVHWACHAPPGDAPKPFFSGLERCALSPVHEMLLSSSEMPGLEHLPLEPLPFLSVPTWCSYSEQEPASRLDADAVLWRPCPGLN